METKKQRLDYVRKIKGLKYSDLIGNDRIVTPDNLRVTVSRENDKIDYYLSLIAKKHNISEQWLIEGIGEMDLPPRQIQPNKEVDTVDDLQIPDLEDEDLESVENSFGNRFVKLPTGEYLMYMPLFEWDVAASLLDNEGDTRHPDYEDVAQHITIVQKPQQGKYSAFRIKGGSMEGTDPTKYVPDGSIVWGRELQRSLWRDELKINKFPLWIIGSTDFGRPTLKEIVEHKTETATIIVDSWNPSKEYAHNVPVSLNTVKMLYYVMKVETPLADVY